MTGLERELSVKIEECNRLHQELRKRPFEIKTSAETVNTDNHPELTNEIKEKLNNKQRFLVKILIEGERLWCTVIGRSDSHNSNFDDSEDGEIFVGVLDNEPINDKLKFNDLVEFQSCDVLELSTL